MLKGKKFIVFLIVASMGITFCRAAEKNDDEVQKSAWFELGFYSPIQLFGEETEITCFRLSSVYTYNEAVNGLDVGIICESGNSKGVQFAGWNKTYGSMNGLSMGLSNIAEIEMNGVQLAIVYNQAGSDSVDNVATKHAVSNGFQCAWVNSADAVFTGFQLGMLNVSTTLLRGLQIGLINISERPDKTYDEFQTKEFKAEKGKRSCIQLGLINFNPKGIFPVTLLINF